MLLVLLEANPCNKRTLCLHHGVAPFVRAAARCADDEAGGALRLHYLRLAASLGEYSVQAGEALLLFRLAAAPRYQMLRPEACTPLAIRSHDDDDDDDDAGSCPRAGLCRQCFS